MPVCPARTSSRTILRRVGFPNWPIRPAAVSMFIFMKVTLGHATRRVNYISKNLEIMSQPLFGHRVNRAQNHKMLRDGEVAMR
jgi:hypothetical protein